MGVNLCSVIFLASSCFFIEFWTFSSSFSLIFIISLFLASPTFPWRVLLRSFLLCPFFFNFPKQLYQRVIWTVLTIFLSRSPRADLDDRNCHTTTRNKYYYLYFFFIFADLSPHSKAYVTAKSLKKNQDGNLFFARVKTGRSGTWSLVE